MANIANGMPIHMPTVFDKKYQTASRNIKLVDMICLHVTARILCFCCVVAMRKYVRKKHV